MGAFIILFLFRFCFFNEWTIWKFQICDNVDDTCVTLWEVGNSFLNEPGELLERQ